MTTQSRDDYGEVVLEHYRKEAKLYGKDTSSTMLDEITRGREVAGIVRTVEWLASRGAATGRILEVGSGNGYLLSVLRANFDSARLTGLEYTPEMCDVARSRNVERCPIVQGDVRKLPFEESSWDVVVTERCIINIMDRSHQEASLHEVARVMAPGGHFLCLEAFTDGLAQLNAAREELGLPPNAEPHHNVWFDKEWFLDVVGKDFEVVDVGAEGDPSLPTPNFLSSHYFISRAFYPAVTKREVLYNTHLVKFFSFLPPLGNYSPIQFWLLRKR